MALWAFLRTWGRTLSVGLRWPLPTALPLMPHTSCQCSGWLWLLWVVRRPSLLFLVDRMCWPTLTANFSEVGSRKLVEYTVLDLRLLKRCLQKVFPSLFGSLDPFLMTEFIVTRLKGAQHRDWMMSRPSLRHATITGELSMPAPVEIVSNIVGVWPLIVVYHKETGRKTDDDSFVV